MKREVVFKIIAILLPFVFLLLLELLLRFVGYGDGRTLFVDNEKDSRFLQINDKVSLRYFLREENATSTHAVFLKNKPESDSFRLDRLNSGFIYK